MYLVSDIGGTNTRLALAGAEGVHTGTIASFKNAEESTFLDILKQFRSNHKCKKIDGCCVAIAGPVTSSSARLTNFDWKITVAEVGALLSTERVLLINDLAALGNAVEDLKPPQLAVVRPPSSETTSNNQSLIVGIGTGFNLCAVQHRPASRPSCLSVEYGHCGLSARIAEMLDRQFGAAGREMKTVEEIFAGRGFQRLYRIASNGEERSGNEIMAAHGRGDDPVADLVVRFYAELLSALCHDLAYQYLPLSGIYFAGSVARGVLSALDHAEFASAAGTGQGMPRQFSHIPMSLITDDAAALVGCLRRLMV
ncbi:MAG: ROK family protein [Paracoccaceae bacterium]